MKTYQERIDLIREENEMKEKCDECGVIDFSESMFWRDGEIDTDSQYKVSEYLTTNNLDVCCEDCYNDILEEMMSTQDRLDVLGDMQLDAEKDK